MGRILINKNRKKKLRGGNEGEKKLGCLSFGLITIYREIHPPRSEECDYYIV